MPKFSRDKGARGEREFAHFLIDAGFDASRGYFEDGSKDIHCPDLPDVHFEVKRRENWDIHKWIKQANDDAGADKIPVVAAKRNRGEWIAILPMADLLNLLETWYEDAR